MKASSIAQFKALKVSRDLSGGIRIEIGDVAQFVLSPSQAIEFGSAVLKTAGCDVNFAAPAGVPVKLIGKFG